MINQYAMFTATRKLEVYLSGEVRNLGKMEVNPKVSLGLLEVKVENYNSLVNTLNELFSSLVGGMDEIFELYHIDYGENVDVTDYEEDDGVYCVESEDNKEVCFEEVIGEVVESETISDGEFVVEIVLSEAINDLEEDVENSKNRASQVLDEYDKTNVRDIASYSPEDDLPVSVLPEEIDEDSSGHDDLRYLSHTADNVRVDNDPIQIVNVKTAVELEKEGLQKTEVPNIDVFDFAYSSDKDIVDDLIDNDISKYQVKPNDEEYEYENDEDVYEDEDLDDIELHGIETDEEYIDDSIFEIIGDDDNDEDYV